MQNNLLNLDAGACIAKPAPLNFDRQYHTLDIDKILPMPLVDLLNEYAVVYSIPIPFLLIGLLSAASIAIGKSTVVRFKRNQTTYANIYAIIIGQPNANKTQPLRFMLAPIEEYDKELYDIYRASITEYNSKAKDDKGTPPSKQQIVVKDSTQDAVKVGAIHGISKRSVNRFLKDQNYFTRVQFGVYRKEFDTDMD